MNNSAIHLYKKRAWKNLLLFKFIEMQNELLLKKSEEESKIYSTTPLYIGDEGDKNKFYRFKTHRREHFRF